MNGRVFDPVLGRFLSADPLVDDAGDSQAYNRYSYVSNNPLNATDPSGYTKLGNFLLADAIGGMMGMGPGVGASLYATQGGTRPWSIDPMYYAAPGAYRQYAPQIAGIVVGVVVTIATGGNAAAGGAAGGFVSAYAGTMLNGGSLSDAFSAGAIGSACGAFVGWCGANGGIIGSALASGAVSELTGGEFRHGFISSIVGSIAGSVGARISNGNMYVGTVCAAVAGGTASVMGGGKFANGAISGAFSYLATEIGHRITGPNSAAGTGNTLIDAKLANGIYDKNFTGTDGYTMVGKPYTATNGLRAATFSNGTDNVVVYAGTSPSSLANWWANLTQAFGFRSAQYEGGIKYAQEQYAAYNGNVRFTGHSLGGGIASAAAIITGGSATTFNAAGVHDNTLRGIDRSNGSVTSYYSSFDVLHFINAITPTSASVPGQRISLGAAGLHGMDSMVKALGGGP